MSMFPEKTFEDRVQEWMQQGITTPPFVSDPAWDEAQRRLQRQQPLSTLSDILRGGGAVGAWGKQAIPGAVLNVLLPRVLPQVFPQGSLPIVKGNNK